MIDNKTSRQNSLGSCSSDKAVETNLIVDWNGARRSKARTRSLIETPIDNKSRVLRSRSLKETPTLPENMQLRFINEIVSDVGTLQEFSDFSVKYSTINNKLNVPTTINDDIINTIKFEVSNLRDYSDVHTLVHHDYLTNKLEINHVEQKLNDCCFELPKTKLLGKNHSHKLGKNIFLDADYMFLRRPALLKKKVRSRPKTSACA